MSTKKFRAYTEDELPNLEFRSTKEEALADAVARAIGDGTMGLPIPLGIIVEEVRDAVMMDFIDGSQIVSLVREAMQEKIGNDDALSDSAVAAAFAEGIERVIGGGINEVHVSSGARIDGYIVIAKYINRDWWGKAEVDS